MQSRHVLTSSQFAIAFVHDPFSKFGQVPMFQPIAESGSSSPVPHVASPPPHAVAIFSRRRVTAFAIFDDAVSSVWQFVDGGSIPSTLLRSHVLSALARACTYAAELRRIVALHFVVSADAGPTSVTSDSKD